MNGKIFVWLLATVLLTTAPPAEAQQPTNVPRIGYVSGSGNSKTPGPQVEGFRQGLRDLNYIEGKNILVEYRYVERGLDRVPGLVAELVRLKVDVLVATFTVATRAAKQATKTIPIVMVSGADPVAEGYVDSLARPGGNITGVARFTRELSGKRLELLKEAVPRISRVGVLWDGNAAPGPAIAFKEYEAAARNLKLEFQSLEVRGPDPDLDGAFQAAAKGQNLKWGWIIAIGVAFAICGAAAQAQQPKKIPWIGYLSPFDAATETVRAEGIRLALRELSYIEGQNIAIEYRYTEGKTSRLPELAAELVRLKVEIIVAAGGISVIRSAMNATKTIPIVMVGQGSDPVEAGLVESLARPGGNVTGLTSLSRELGGKRLELLKEAVPKGARVGILYDPANPPSIIEVKEVLPVAARALGLALQPWEVRGTDDFDRVFAALNKQRPDGLYVSSGPLINVNQKRITGLALKSRLPSMYYSREAVDAGGLMYYGADLADSYRRVANYVDKILKGAKPADLPVERPTKFELVINLKAAKQIGLTIPQSMLYRANKVIQ